MDIAKLLVTEIPPLFFFLSTPPMSLSNVSRLGGWLCMFVVLGVLTSSCLHSCSVSTTVATTTTTTIIPEVLEPEIKSLRTSLTGSLDHRLELGVLPKSGSTASFHHSSSAHRLAGSSSKFGSIRNIKVSSTLIRAVHFPRNNSIIREEVKSIDSSARLNGGGGGGSVSSPLQIIHLGRRPWQLQRQQQHLWAWAVDHFQIRRDTAVVDGVQSIERSTRVPDPL